MNNESNSKVTTNDIQSIEIQKEELKQMIFFEDSKSEPREQMQRWREELTERCAREQRLQKTAASNTTSTTRN